MTHYRIVQTSHKPEIWAIQSWTWYLPFWTKEGEAPTAGLALLEVQAFINFDATPLPKGQPHVSG